MIGFTVRLSRWGRRVAESETPSAELKRVYDVLYEAFGEGFDAYHHTDSEAGEALAEVLEQLVGSMGAVEDALRDAEAREADPEHRAEIHDLLAHPRSARLREDLRRVEAS